MSVRLQVVLDDKELADIRQIAEGRRQTVSEWVREALRAARRRQPTGDVGRKIAVVREAAQHIFPTTSPEGMLGEIERGYGGETVP